MTNQISVLNQLTGELIVANIKFIYDINSHIKIYTPCLTQLSQRRGLQLFIYIHKNTKSPVPNAQGATILKLKNKTLPTQIVGEGWGHGPAVLGPSVPSLLSLPALPHCLPHSAPCPVSVIPIPVHTL